ncbi:MAG: DUF3696 domain-containing protein [Candidatus Schekmanbacteria bacterium]|nr:DUF3696 domain-containing protein [Candidatus Schekmanbacteria bacterium]
MDLQLNCAELTVLTGTNGAGKTSIIHALLLVRQAALDPEKTSIELNGVYSLQLGGALDVIHRQSSDTAEIWMKEDAQEMHWIFRAPEDDRALSLAVDQPPRECSGALADPSQKRFTYLSADRFGPRDVLGASSVDSNHLGVGVHGEFVAQALVASDLHRVSAGRCIQPSEGALIQKLLHQTEAWMSDIVRPIQMEPEWFPGTSVTRLRFKTPGVSTDWMRAPNMGFGISYALPIVVAALRAPVGGLLIIENPEAHLHPAGQSAIGAFLAVMATDGVQVILETHSDHLLNGIRKAVATGRAGLTPEQVAIHFFRGEAELGEAVESMRLEQTGQLSSWPKGFFDQSQRDLAELARAHRRKS